MNLVQIHASTRTEYTTVILEYLHQHHNIITEDSPLIMVLDKMTYGLKLILDTEQNIKVSIVYKDGKSIHNAGYLEQREITLLRELPLRRKLSLMVHRVHLLERKGRYGHL